MIRMQKLNVVRIVETEDQKTALKGQGFEEIGTVAPDYADMKLDELKQLAKDKNVENYSTMKKEDLIAVLKGLGA